MDLKLWKRKKKEDSSIGRSKWEKILQVDLKGKSYKEEMISEGKGLSQDLSKRFNARGKGKKMVETKIKKKMSKCKVKRETGRRKKKRQVMNKKKSMERLGGQRKEAMSKKKKRRRRRVWSRWRRVKVKKIKRRKTIMIKIKTTKQYLTFESLIWRLPLPRPCGGLCK